MGVEELENSFARLKYPYSVGVQVKMAVSLISSLYHRILDVL